MVDTLEDKIQLKHPDSTKVAPRISVTKYAAVRAAILEVVDEDQVGVSFVGLADKVAALLAPPVLQELGSVGWYTTAVKLHLEANGEIERVPGARPQRLRRVQR